VGVERPDGVVEAEVEAGLEPKSRVGLVLHGPAPWSREETHLFSSLTTALEIRLREILREELGGTYGVSVGGSLTSRPHQEFSLSVGFGCAPERAESLLQRVLAELAAVRESGFSEETVDKVREQQRRQREEDLEQNEFWLGTLANYYRLGLDPLLILDHEELVETVTAANLQAAADRYLDTGRSVRAILYPEAGATASEAQAVGEEDDD
jgi:zinc protease